MDVESLKLDGNAAGGLLNEVFPFEMTTAEIVCAGCSTTKLVAELMLYAHGMGSVLRCPACDTAVLRITHIRDSYRLDLSGVSALQIFERAL
jgi:hypothetical protein